MTAALLFAAALAVAAPGGVQVLAQRDDVVWGFDFLPDGRILFTERGGALGLLDPKTGAVSPVAGAPAVWRKGQGGLLDVKAHPDFTKNKLVYLTWSQPIESGAATALGRGRLETAALTGFERLFLSNAGSGNGEHFGSRVEFDGTYLYLTLGERGHRDLSQDLKRHNGKILRLTHDGNPAGAGLPDALPEIWSWGHRNPQGIAKRPGTDQLWEAEFGPRGGDELNRVKRGANYGWPVITYGREYWGPKIGATTKEGMEQPVAYWTPVISPSGMTFLDKDTIALACLSGEHIRLVTLQGDKVAAQRTLLADRGWRVRHVRKGPDGRLYFSTDDGKIARFTPGL